MREEGKDAERDRSEVKREIRRSRGCGIVRVWMRRDEIERELFDVD